MKTGMRGTIAPVLWLVVGTVLGAGSPGKTGIEMLIAGPITRAQWEKIANHPAPGQPSFFL